MRGRGPYSAARLFMCEGGSRAGQLQALVRRRASLFWSTVPDIRDASPPSIGLVSPHGHTFGMNRSDRATAVWNRVTAPIKRVRQVPTGRDSGFAGDPLDTEARGREGRSHVFLDRRPADDGSLIGWEHDAIISHRVDTRLQVASRRGGCPGTIRGRHRTT